MANTIKKDEKGRKVYKGLLSAQERKQADELLDDLIMLIPPIEKRLLDEYGDSIEYKYYLGNELGNLLDKYNISDRERIYFWQEIRAFASEGDNAKDRSDKRMLYEQCFMLSQLDKDTVKKLSWRQWQDLLDRPKNRADGRIFDWIKNSPDKIRQDDWREFEKVLHSYLKNHDTSFFSDEEIYELFDQIIVIVSIWREEFKEYIKQLPKDKVKYKMDHKNYYRDRYYRKCIDEKRHFTANNIETLCKNYVYEFVEKSVTKEN